MTKKNSKPIQSPALAMTHAPRRFVPGKSYQMRTECQPDCDVARGLLNPWLASWTENSARCPDTGDLLPPDMDVEFTLVESAPELCTLRWLLSLAVDLHVAAESLDLAEKYSGKRIDYEVIPLGQASNEEIAAMLPRLTRFHNCTASSKQRVSGALRELQATLKASTGRRGTRAVSVAFNRH